MKTIKCLLFVITLLFSVPTGAVTVSLTGNWVGIDGTFINVDGDEVTYWAGIVELDIDGKQYMAMPVVPWGSPSDSMGVSWDANLYTRDDILSGGTNTMGAFVDDWSDTTEGTESYAKASQFFLDGLLGYDPPDPLWAASFNEMIWQTIFFVPWTGIEGENYFFNANTIYDTLSGVRLRDVYDMEIANGLDPNYDYSGFMRVLGWGDGTAPTEFIVFTSAVPVPAALWLFASGLIGFVALARKKHLP